MQGPPVGCEEEEEVVDNGSDNCGGGGGVIEEETEMGFRFQNLTMPSWLAVRIMSCLEL
jgi:hypothetical protein